MAENDRISFLDGGPPEGFDMRLISVDPGATRPFREEDWQDSLVVLERGELDITCVRGGCRRFHEGAVMWLAGLPLVALHNPGREPVLIAAVSRRRSQPMNSDAPDRLNGKATA